MLLGLPGRTPGVMVRGELGWITMEARRHIAMLRFFYRLQRMDGRRLVRQVFRTRMLELRSNKTLGDRSEGFCAESLRLLVR